MTAAAPAWTKLGDRASRNPAGTAVGFRRTEAILSWRSVFVWATLGAVIGVATLAGLLQPKSREIAAWCVAAIIWGVAAGRGSRNRPFQHGFLMGFVGGFAAGLLETVFFGTYRAHNPVTDQAYASLSTQFKLADSLLRLSPVASGVFMSGFYGCVVGGLALVAARVERRSRAA